MLTCSLASKEYGVYEQNVLYYLVAKTTLFSPALFNLCSALFLSSFLFFFLYFLHMLAEHDTLTFNLIMSLASLR